MIDEPNEPDPKDDVPHVLFSGDGRGRWRKITWQHQCPATVFMAGRCQGVEGHKWVHWRFGADGWFCYDDNEDDPSEGGSSGTIPPNHSDYRAPAEMTQHHHRYFFEAVDVTDPEEIARLERGELRDGESMTRPLPPGESVPIDPSAYKGRCRGKPKVGG